MCDHPGSPSQCGQAPFGSLLGFSGQHGEGGPVHIRSGMEIPHGPRTSVSLSCYLCWKGDCITFEAAEMDSEG